jgi:hypothetical protein
MHDICKRHEIAIRFAKACLRSSTTQGKPAHASYIKKQSKQPERPQIYKYTEIKSRVSIWRAESTLVQYSNSQAEDKRLRASSQATNVPRNRDGLKLLNDIRNMCLVHTIVKRAARKGGPATMRTLRTNRTGGTAQSLRSSPRHHS